MKKSLRMGLLLVLLCPLCAMAQSVLDGTWKIDTNKVDMPKKPDVIVLQNGTYQCQTCAPAISVKADGDLSVKGCILGVLCGGETWKRIAPPAAAAVSTKPRSPDAKTEARTARPDHAISASEQ